MYNQVPEIGEDQSVLERMQEMTRELERVRAELRHSQRLTLLGTLSAGIAHEINNVLTPVLAYAQMASARLDDRQLQVKALQRCVHGVEAVSQILEAMLGFASPENQAVDARADVAAVIKSAIDCLGRGPEKDRIQVIVEVVPGTWVRIRPLALQQVLMNLILNACAAMRKRGGQIRISAQPDSNQTVLIQVADNGPGIPPELAHRLFEPFALANSVHGRAASQGSTDVCGGTGLGLSICKRLVIESGGTICLDSAPGTGARFSIRLPATSIQLAKAG